MLVALDLKIILQLQDSNSLFSLQLIRVHRAFIVYRHPSESQQTIHEGGLAVIDVSNDGYIPGSLEKFLGVIG